MTMGTLPKPKILMAEIDAKTKIKVDIWCKEAIDCMGKHKFTLPEKAYALKILVEGFEDAVERLK